MNIVSLQCVDIIMPVFNVCVCVYVCVFVCGSVCVSDVTVWVCMCVCMKWVGEGYISPS